MLTCQILEYVFLEICKEDLNNLLLMSDITTLQVCFHVAQ